jgi:hypothetical protein
VPDLVLTPLVGGGYMSFSGKTERRSVGTVPVPNERVDFDTDVLLGQATAILEYRLRRGALNIRPGASVGYIYAESFRGNADLVTDPPTVPARGKARVVASSTLIRAAVRVDGPLGVSLARTDLRWQAFVVGNYNTSSVGLFPWSVELGAAIGADFGRLGRSLVGFDPGELYVGASYITGENLSGFRVNFGFRF